MTRPRRDDSGFTVVEMAVTVMIMGIASVMFLNFLNNTMTLTRRAEKDSQGEQAMTLALRTMTEDLRSASNVYACTAALYKNCLVIDVPRGQSVGLSCPSKTVTYSLSNGTLSATEVDYGASSCTTTTTKWNNRPLLQSVVNGAGENLFTFYDGNGNVFDPDSGAYTAAQAAAMVTTSGSIKAFVRVNYGMNGAPTISMSSFAALRNHR
jgi:prepilin-type N-terminal cleavage/methylation domain-containing protein